MGKLYQHLGRTLGDFILRRKDGPFAYQLGVIVDDDLQNITQIVRGADLYEQTPRQLFLQQCLQLATPHYAYVAVIVNAQGQKLSKQHLTPGLDTKQTSPSMTEALHCLGYSVPTELSGATATELLNWEVARWNLQQVAKRHKDPQPFLGI